MNDRLFTTNGVDLSVERFGDPNHPTILLIMGAKASMLWWDDRFCRLLADSARHVIRFDNRDTGRSSCAEPGNPDHTLDDLAEDVVRVLDALAIQRAHLVGMSLGGMMAQMAALAHPERVASITIIASTPISHDGPDLPEMAAAVIDHHVASLTLDWTDHPAVLTHLVEAQRILAGSGHTFDRDAARLLAKRELARARNMASTVNFGLLTGGDAFQGRLQQIRQPTLVIHGTDDPALPLEHGQAIARVIPGARLLVLEGTGHELHPDDWDTIVGAILEHTRQDIA